MTTVRMLRLAALLLLGLSLAVSNTGGADTELARSNSASITVYDTVLGQTTTYIGATEGGSFDIDDLTNCGISTYRIWIGMSDVEYCDDNDPRGYVWGCDQAGNTNYGSPTIAAIKANPNVIDWTVWDEHINNPIYRWRTSKNPDTAFGTMVQALSSNGILPVLCLRNRDEYGYPAWAPNPPTTNDDLNEWWQYCFAVAYWFNVRNSYGVTHFEVHNEPDLSSQGWGGTEAQYAQLLVPYAYDAVKTANDLARIDTVVMASVESQMPFPRTYTYFDDVFDNADSYIKIADFHWYHMNGTYPLSDLEAAIDDVRGQITSHNPDGVVEPLWVSEYGNFSSSNAYDNLQEAIRTAQQLMIFSRKEVEGVNIFAFYDWGSTPGLVKGDGTKTETYYAYRLMIRGLKGAKDRMQFTSSGVSGDIMVTAGGGKVYIIVINGGATIQADVSDLGVDDGDVNIYGYSSTIKDTIVATPTISGGRFTFDAPASGIALAEITPSPTVITLVSFTAIPLAGAVLLEWETASEIDTAGFNLWRSEVEVGPYTKLNADLIPARGGPTTGASYSYLDEAVTSGVTYWYKLEDVDIHGVSTFHGPVSATPHRLHQIYLPLLLKGSSP